VHGRRASAPSHERARDTGGAVAWIRVGAGHEGMPHAVDAFQPRDRMGRVSIPTMKVSIRRAAVDGMMRHAREEMPNECCGLLVGTARTIERAVPARNLRASPTRFLVDPADHFKALREARGSGLSVVGAYHSHPASGAQPSETDVAEINDPALLQVIVSLVHAVTGPRIRGFRMADGNFFEVELVLVDGHDGA
jgi:proteasome lid subunit RPN8/RPN11